MTATDTPTATARTIYGPPAVVRAARRCGYGMVRFAERRWVGTPCQLGAVCIGHRQRGYCRDTRTSLPPWPLAMRTSGDRMRNCHSTGASWLVVRTGVRRSGSLRALSWYSGHLAGSRMVSIRRACRRVLLATQPTAGCCHAPRLGNRWHQHVLSSPCRTTRSVLRSLLRHPHRGADLDRRSAATRKWLAIECHLRAHGRPRQSCSIPSRPDRRPCITTACSRCVKC